MMLAWIIRVLSSLFFTVTAAHAVSLSLHGCQEKCGNVTIPYPFGIGPNCSANSSYSVVCQNSTNPAKPYLLSSTKLEILDIFLYGVVIVNQPVVPMNCSDRPITVSQSVTLKGSPFTISAWYNSLVVNSCKNLVWTKMGGCVGMCDANSTDTGCNGVNCCQLSIPSPLQELQYTYQTIQESNSSYCGYVFLLVTEVSLSSDWNLGKEGYANYMYFPFDPESGFAPLALDWRFDTDKAIRNNSAYRWIEDTSSISYWSCNTGFEGNPYIIDGCSDIDECSDGSWNACGAGSTCTNIYGSYSCYYYTHTNGYYIDHNDGFRVILKIASIVIGGVLGLLSLIIAAWKFGKAITQVFKLIKASRRYMFFKRNGGLLLEQQLAAIESGIEKIRLFSSIELSKATDDFNESRILGRGGEGVVYKGMLEDGRIVAVKKLEMVGQGDVEAFVNEVVIVAQINHRNVVKLLGCCLESESPRLVYEFIPNGTLFHHIHDQIEDFPLFWEMRVRISKEVAEALAYLHSAASVPIYHRDIKSTNILLDEKYRAKISDFGTSRSVLIDQTHVTTRVVGTFGYLDPEYFQSSQFTEKSDVYSYGVVLVELLTGEKAISAARVEEGKGLAMHFLHSMEANQLLDIVDARVLKEGKGEDIEAMAEIARKCLHLNGKSRPTMKEVTRQLDGIQIEKGVRAEQKSGCSSIEDDDSDDFSELDEPDPAPEDDCIV